MMLWIRFDVIGDRSDFAIDSSNNPRNCPSDVWYIRFTMDISTGHTQIQM